MKLHRSYHINNYNIQYENFTYIALTNNKTVIRETKPETDALEKLSAHFHLSIFLSKGTKWNRFRFFEITDHIWCFLFKAKRIPSFTWEVDMTQHLNRLSIKIIIFLLTILQIFSIPLGYKLVQSYWEMIQILCNKDIVARRPTLNKYSTIQIVQCV